MSIRSHAYDVLLAVWTVGVIAGAIAIFAGHSSQGRQEDPDFAPPSIPVRVVEMATGKEFVLFAQGPPTAGVILTLDCPACRGALPEILRWLSENPADRRVLVTLDSTVAGTPLATNFPASVLLAHVPDTKERSKLGNLFVPTFFTVDESGEIVSWLSGLAEFHDYETEPSVR